MSFKKKPFPSVSPNKFQTSGQKEHKSRSFRNVQVFSVYLNKLLSRSLATLEVGRFWMDFQTTCCFKLRHVTAGNQNALWRSLEFMLPFLHFTQKSVIKWSSNSIAQSHKLALGIKMKHVVPIIINSAKALQHFNCAHMRLLAVDLSHLITLLEFRLHDKGSLRGS